MAIIYKFVPWQGKYTFEVISSANYRHSTPLLVDLNNDGYLDLLIGRFRANTSTHTNSHDFDYRVYDPDTNDFVIDDDGYDGLGSTINIQAGEYSTPQLVDLDDDGDLDALVGVRIAGDNEGRIRYTRNDDISAELNDFTLGEPNFRGQGWLGYGDEKSLSRRGGYRRRRQTGHLPQLGGSRQ